MKKKRIAAALLCIAACVLAGMGIREYILEANAGSSYDRVRTEVEKNETEAAETQMTEKQTAESQTTEAQMTETLTAETEAASTESDAEVFESSTEGETEKASESEVSNPPEIPIDFNALWEENPEAYAWIRIPGTVIDYPILQSETDNAYYLNHNIDGEESPEGAIFTEDYNKKDFTDPNTVLYGHNMKNGSMFQGLHDYMDRTFFDENREVLIYLPDQILHYEIFAAYQYDDRHLLLSFDFEDPDVYQKYLDSIFAIRDMNAFVDTTMDVTAEDKILTLSTCYSNYSDDRYLVQAVLVSIES